MGFFNINKKNNVSLKSCGENNIAKLRKKIKILMIDDEEYDIFDVLKDRGYNIYYKNEISYVEETEPFDIIILDIKGVAKKFSSPYEGFGFAKEVKMLYPNKIVLCYSGTCNAEINEELSNNVIDGFINKDTSSDKWSVKLDSYIKKYLNIYYQWQQINSKLINEGIAQDKIDLMKEAYINSFNTDSFDELKNTFMNTINNAKLCVDTLLSVVSIIKLLV